MGTEESAAGLIRLGQRMRQWDARHRWALDTAGVLVLFLLFGLPDLSPGREHPDGPITLTQRPVPQMLLLQAALLVPLWWRRRFPLLTFSAVVAVFIAEWAAGVMLRADVALLVAVYSLVLHGRLRRLPWAIPALLAASALVVTRVSGIVSAWDALFFVAVVGTAAVALGFAIRVRRAQLEALRDRAVQLEIERDQRSRLAAATERTRVAREMHDILGHSLSVIVTLADGGAYAADVAPERGKEALRHIGDTGRRSLADLRRMLGVLREQSDGLSPQPGLADVEALCRRVRAAGPEVEYQSGGDLAALDLGVQLAAYRIVQEALTNTLKHAGSHTKVHLALRVEGPRLRIVVRDTGPSSGGGDRTARSGGPGHGLIGMRERAALYGGSVEAGPAPGGGWSVTADLDLTPPPPIGGDLA
ncbi:sensor histidine kinase [Dactylosporangium sp. NPDC051541]|uniref:sensor histidine kinase n=1 Tax=Dactylosporangium sp. NPDC051541 TaxID=3363977 RepID=UPI0037BB42A9